MVEGVRLARYRAGVPVYRYIVEPSAPPVSVIRLRHGVASGDRAHPHVHDFPVLAYFEQDCAGPLPGGFSSSVRTGDLLLLAPGVVVRPDHLATPSVADGVGIFFSPQALSPDSPGPLTSSWTTHPLLLPFVHGTASGLIRLRVPEDERPRWTGLIAALETELLERREGYQRAALAYLTLLLVDVARLAGDVVGDLRRSNEGLLAEVFEVIERRFRERLSLRDVARAVNLSPGHLTTVVRRRTGRTVQDWIVERRMSEARRLLAETDLPVAEVARGVGFDDPSYFGRRFRAEHGRGPRAWRRQAMAG